MTHIESTPTGAIVQPGAQMAALKAETLVESLPWLKQFQGTTFVIKFGGNAMTDAALMDAFAADIVYLRYVGIRPVVVHGGGPQITSMLDKLGIVSEFRAGYRYTTPEAMAVVRMVLTGRISRDIISRINQHGPLAVGLSGEDAGLFQAKRFTPIVDGAPVDLGLVGEIESVDAQSIRSHLDAGRIPVVSPIAPDEHDSTQVLNVNADAAAAALAEALGAAKLVILTNVAGLYSDWPDRSSLLSEVTTGELRKMMPRLESGMIPKMQACLDAVEGGVGQAAVVDGRIPHSTLLEIFTDDGIGTQVVAS